MSDIVKYECNTDEKDIESVDFIPDDPEAYKEKMQTYARSIAFALAYGIAKTLLTRR